MDPQDLHQPLRNQVQKLCPNLKNLPRGQSQDSPGDENEESFVASEDLTSRSSRRLQSLELALLGLSSQCHVLRGPGGRPRGHVKGLSTSDAEFYHHAQAAVFGRHYVRLQRLLEQRAQLLFLHEYARRCRAANCLLTRLADVLQRARLLTSNGDQSLKEKPRPCWNLGIRGLGEELRMCVCHWDLLSSRLRSDAFLRHLGVTACREMLGSMRRNLRLLASQALLLMERCINAQIYALASAHAARVPRDALEDLVSAVELYNRTAMYQRAQKNATWWTWDIAPPQPFSIQDIMEILARRRAHDASEKLHRWACDQAELLSLAGQRGTPWEDSITRASDRATPDDRPESTTSKDHALPFPPLTRTNNHTQDILDAFLQALAPSTDLASGWADAKRDRRSHRTPTGQDAGPETAHKRSRLFSQYSRTYWTEFPRAFRKRFYYSGFTGGALGGVDQWNHQMVFLLVKWLRHPCKPESFPDECKDALRKILLSVSSTAAFTRWDEMMCKSLGSGLKEKCVPGAVADPSTVRTATMTLTLQMFPPLLWAIQLHPTPHPTPHPNSGQTELRSRCPYTSGLLCRAQAAIQSSSFWVLSKAFQFLSSWSVCKFLLVTRGDLKVLRETAEAVALRLQDAYGAEEQITSEREPQLVQAVSRLQASSDLVLRRFSTDCKKMSVEMFEQTMPPPKHWRVQRRWELPSSPSDYAVLAAQSVIGQVLEGVRPLPDEAGAPALAETLTAFVEAWMEHVLRRKIKFSIQGALQLKQDFNFIREFLRSEKYSLSEELYQRLLSLHVFHQMDGAIVCLLQQPVAKTYTPSLRWEPFRHCCPNTAQVVDQSVRSLNNLETMDNQGTCQHALSGVGGSVTPELGSTAPPGSYLAVAQQEWLDLRIHTGSRWRIPGLRCFSKSES